MEKKEFGTTKDGKVAHTYQIANTKGMSAILLDYGAAIVSLNVAGKDGRSYDVSLGYDNVTDYENGTCFFGATVGRNANRISNARITIDDVNYDLGANDNENNLHSGVNGTSNVMWEVKGYSDNAITFSYESGHLEQGFPGKAVMEVTYTVTENGELAIF